MTEVIAGLALGAAGVVVAGVMLARSGDVIAARTRLGGLWFGLVFLSLATSLPELVTAGAAVRIGAPDLAAGDLFGSNMANMLILALVSLMPRAALFSRVALDQALVATHAISLTSIAAAFILLAPDPLVGRLGPGSALVLVAWVAGSRAIYQHSALARETVAQAETAAEPPPPPDDGAPGVGRAVLRFALGTVIVLVTAPVFAVSAERAVELSGLGEGFFGTVVLGVATSLPELVTAAAAVRIGAYDLAASNLFGSNAVNMVMFVPLDLLHGPGPILATVGEIHAFTGFASVVMMSLAMSAIVFRAKRRFSMLEPSAALIVLVYLLSVGVMYAWNGGG